MDTLAGNGRTDTRHAQAILRKQIRRAARKLNGGGAGDGDIHDARRHIKRARATLRLFRSSVSGTVYRTEDRLLSRASRPLGVLRDDRILIENLDQLVSRYRGAAPIRGTTQLRLALRASLEHDRDRLGGEQRLRETRRLLKKARRKAANWPTHGSDGERLLRAVCSLYRAGRRALEATLRSPSVDQLHGLRKRAKYLAHQLRLFAPKKSSSLGRAAAGFHQLSDELGEDHDLAVLREAVIARLENFPDRQSQTRLVALIDQSRTALQKKALLRAETLYGETSGRFAQRLRKACRAAPAS